MRINVKLTKEEKNQFETFQAEPLIKTKKTAIRMVIALGLSKMAEGKTKKLSGNEILKFNTATIDPEGVFEVVAYYVLSKRLGASVDKKKIIVAKKDEIAETISEGFVLGLKELPNFQKRFNIDF
jgi:hypothetical protein